MVYFNIQLCQFDLQALDFPTYSLNLFRKELELKKVLIEYMEMANNYYTTENSLSTFSLNIIIFH